MKLPENTVLGATLTMLKVYDRYDFPRLFVCVNGAGHHYLAIWQNETEAGDVWLYAATDTNSLGPVAMGLRDIRDAFLDAPAGVVLRVTTSKHGATVEPVRCEDLAADDLPPAGDKLRPQLLLNRPTVQPRNNVIPFNIALARAV